jgi:hypothetical protein
MDGWYVSIFGYRTLAGLRASVPPPYPRHLSLNPKPVSSFGYRTLAGLLYPSLAGDPSLEYLPLSLPASFPIFACPYSLGDGYPFFIDARPYSDAGFPLRDIDVVDGGGEAEAPL